MQSIIDAVSKVRVGAPTTFQNLAVFPLLTEFPKAANYLTLDEGLARQTVRITEVSEGASVPQLELTNSGDSRVFLLDGEELVGAKQNRVLNLSIMAPAGKTIVIPVSCVEAHRWRHMSAEFASSPRTHFSEGRAKKMAQVSESMSSSGTRFSDQAEVWTDIGRKFEELGVESPTEAMSAMYETLSHRIEDYVKVFTPEPGQVGAMFAIDGRLTGLDLFDSPDTLRKLLLKIVRSYALDAIARIRSRTAPAESSAPPSLAAAQELLASIPGAVAATYPAVGEGQDVRLKGARLDAAALELEDRVIHLSAFQSTDGHNEQRA
jgi:hypothetical protein